MNRVLFQERGYASPNTKPRARIVHMAPPILRIVFTLGIGAVIHFLPRDAHAQAPESVFGYAFQGLGIGAPIGLSASYLLTRDDSWAAEDWRDLGLGAAIGAISGAAGGLAVGLADLSDGRVGSGAIVLRDTWYGTLLGITIGAVVGGVHVMSSGESEDILVGMAWGAVIGAPVGVGVGVVEAALRGEFSDSDVRSSAAAVHESANESASPFRIAIIPVISTREQRQWGVVPTVMGTF